MAGRGGNLLLNVGPGPDGALPAPQVERLAAIAGWMGRHGEAIGGTTAGLEPWQWYGPSTRRGDRTYLFAPWRPADEVVVRGVPIRRVERVVHLASGAELPFTTRTSVLEELVGADPLGEVVVAVGPEHLDDLVSVFAVDVTPP